MCVFERHRGHEVVTIDPLKDKEIYLINGFFQNKTIKAIAAEQGCKEATYIDHKTSLYQKFCVNTRMNLFKALFDLCANDISIKVDPTLEDDLRAFEETLRKSEYDVLLRITKGKTIAEISNDRFTSIQTTRDQLISIYKKFHSVFGEKGGKEKLFILYNAIALQKARTALAPEVKADNLNQHRFRL